MEKTITVVSDFVLLRSLADDVPDMALTVREHLRHIANKLESGDKVGKMRCRKCGESVDILIHTMRVPNVELTRLAVGQSGGAQRNES